jgi:hypothetical protein
LGCNTNIHIEMSQGNSLYSYLKETKMSFFFSFTKLQNRRAEQALSWGWYQCGRVEDVGKGFTRVNMVQILCTHVCKWKNEACLLQHYS